MKPQVTLAVLGAVLIAILVVGLRQWLTTQETQTVLFEISHRRESARAELQALLASLARLAADRDRMGRSLKQKESRIAEVRASDAIQQQKARTRILHAWMTLRNGRLYQKLGFSSAQIAQYEDITVSHYLRMQDIAATAQAEKLTGADPAIAKLAREEDQRSAEEMAAALGDGLAQQIRQYDRAAPARMLADAAASMLYYTETPVTAEQGEQLTQSLADSSNAYRNGRPVNLANLDIDSALAQAKDAMAPQQLAAAKNIYQGLQAVMKLNQLIVTLNKGNAPAGPAK